MATFYLVEHWSLRCKISSYNHVLAGILKDCSMLTLAVAMVALASMMSMGSAFQCRIGAASWNSRTSFKLLRPVDILSSTRTTTAALCKLTILPVSIPKIGHLKNSGLRAVQSNAEADHHIHQPKIWGRSIAKKDDPEGLAFSVDEGENGLAAGVESPAWTKETAASIASKAKLELMVQPSKRIVQLEYDYQSSSSIYTIKHKWWRKKLSAVSTAPTAKGKRMEGSRRTESPTQSTERDGDAYLVDWWHSARKWGLLTDQFLAMLQELQPATHEHSPGQSNMPAEYIDQPVSIREPNRDGGSTSKNSLPNEESYEHINIDTAASAGEITVAIKAAASHPNPADSTGSAQVKAPSPRVSVNEEIKEHPLFASFSAIHVEPVMSSAMKEKVAAASALAAKKRQKQQNSARGNQLHAKKRRLLQKAQQKAMQQKVLLAYQQHAQRTTTSTSSSTTHISENGNKRVEADAQLETRRADTDTAAGAEEAQEAQEAVPLAALHALCRSQQARVIAVGDVHGCVDELCDLLREVIYRPGDQIVLLGDLVAKGPKSVEVVRLAMDLGALSVRGNHDHEVVHKYYSSCSSSSSSSRLLPKMGDGPSDTPQFTHDEAEAARQSSITHVIPNTDNKDNDKDINCEWYRKLSKHAKIAHLLSPEELAWLGDLPYIIHSESLKALFVHAGLQRNVSLADQQPRVVMNMCSQLTSGRVSIASLKDFAWAPQWTGPLTAYFGHDTSRGLQKCPWAYGLDTGCVYGGKLTAMLLPEQKLVSVPARKAYVKVYGKSKDGFCV